MKICKLNETYIDDLKKGSSKKYVGQPIYRVTATVQEDNRPQMYTIGLGKRDEDNTNYFEPLIRAARYTTEESIVFLSREKAQAFLRMFAKEYEGEFDLDDFGVTQYKPFREITKLIPITTPYGSAYVTEQKAIKKSYEE